jgi:hypothetical protein
VLQKQWRSTTYQLCQYEAAFELTPERCSYLADYPTATPAPKHHYLVPSNQVAHFIGREDILTNIESSFALSKKRSHPVTLILHAMGGQGKTQVALELCRRCKPDCRAIFWINATSETTAGRDIEIIAPRLNTPLKRTFDDVPSKVEFVKETLENWNEPWMMIFDNYDSPTGFENIKDFMPSSEPLISPRRYSSNSCRRERIDPYYEPRSSCWTARQTYPATSNDR